MFPLGEIGGWQMLKVLLSSLPEITLWVFVLGGLGLLLGIGFLMASLRWMLPWARLYELRQGKKGWLWLVLQWVWVILWGASMPILCMSTGALSGGAFGAHRLVQRENVGQVMGERILGPIATQLARQLQRAKPDWGDLTTQQLDAEKLRVLMEEVSPAMLDSALKKVTIFNDADPGVSPTEQWGRRFARRGVEMAAGAYFAQKSRFISDLSRELKNRKQEKATLHQVVCCASHLYFTPAFARWTFWWILAQAAALIPILGAIWLLPWGLFHLFWWWRRRKIARLAESTQDAG
ncbi:hypothetical protein JST97_33855 [bacterium]|nr:hypothetical protein [bacterium]